VVNTLVSINEVALH